MLFSTKPNTFSTNEGMLDFSLMRAFCSSVKGVLRSLLQHFISLPLAAAIPPVGSLYSHFSDSDFC